MMATNNVHNGTKAVSDSNYESKTEKHKQACLSVVELCLLFHHHVMPPFQEWLGRSSAGIPPTVLSRHREIERCKRRAS